MNGLLSNSVKLITEKTLELRTMPNTSACGPLAILCFDRFAERGVILEKIKI